MPRSTRKTSPPPPPGSTESAIPPVPLERMLPLPNYTLSSVCPACTAPTIRRACKVRCERCGFVWDCSEL